MEMDFKEAHFDENFIKPCGKASKLLLPFNSHEWPRQNFSLQYYYSIDQTSDENEVKYQFGDN